MADASNYIWGVSLLASLLASSTHGPQQCMLRCHGSTPTLVALKRFQLLRTVPLQRAKAHWTTWESRRRAG